MGVEEIKSFLREKTAEYSYTQAAKDSGIDRTHIYTMLSRRGNPSLISLVKLTKALGLRIHIEKLGGNG